jgi:hypothetical protein
MFEVEIEFAEFEGERSSNAFFVVQASDAEQAAIRGRLDAERVDEVERVVAVVKL